MTPEIDRDCPSSIEPQLPAETDIDRTRGKVLNRNLLRLIRVAMSGLILLSIHTQYGKHRGRESADSRWNEVLDVVKERLPAANEIQVHGDSVSSRITDHSGQVIAYAVQTFPVSRHIVGFSGPTNVVLLFNPHREVMESHLLFSGDTREHVERILQNPEFLSALSGRTPEQLLDLRDVDTVSGATLTSCAVLESIRYSVARVADSSGLQPQHSLREHAITQQSDMVHSLRFPDPPRIEDVRLLYSNAERVFPDPHGRHFWVAETADGVPCGRMLRGSPLIDNSIGYQGPTDVLIAIRDDLVITGTAVGVSYDNQPYVSYVRDDTWFRSLVTGRALHDVSMEEMERVEGVSGATMTSQAVARSIGLIAQQFAEEAAASPASSQSDAGTESPSLDDVARSPQHTRTRNPDLRQLLSLRNVSTSLIVLAGMTAGLTRLRSRRGLRIILQLVMIFWLGLINGDLLSQAQLLGWAQNGIPWQYASGLVVLTVLAVTAPIATRRNPYCSHVCPHGALQQLVRRRLPWQWRLAPMAGRWLKRVPWVLLLFVVAIGMLHLPFSPVNLEPFDAWLPTVAGVAALSIALISLVISLFIPMAYCRFGCPTGTMLDYLGGVSERSWQTRDTCVAIVALSAACFAFLF